MHARALDARQPCSCPSCLAERGERACPDCGSVIPAAWARCWPCGRNARPPSGRSSGTGPAEPTRAVSGGPESSSWTRWWSPTTAAGYGRPARERATRWCSATAARVLGHLHRPGGPARRRRHRVPLGPARLRAVGAARAVHGRAPGRPGRRPPPPRPGRDGPARALWGPSWPALRPGPSRPVTRLVYVSGVGPTRRRPGTGSSSATWSTGSAASWSAGGYCGGAARARPMSGSWPSCSSRPTSPTAARPLSSPSARQPVPRGQRRVQPRPQRRPPPVRRGRRAAPCLPGLPGPGPAGRRRRPAPSLGRRLLGAPSRRPAGSSWTAPTCPGSRPRPPRRRDRLPRRRLDEHASHGRVEEVGRGAGEDGAVPRWATLPRRLGAIWARPPRRIANEPKLAKPQRAKVTTATVLSDSESTSGPKL